VKCQFGYRKVRYRGIAKNGAQVFSQIIVRVGLRNRLIPGMRVRCPPASFNGYFSRRSLCTTSRMTAALAQWVPRLIGLSLASQNLAALILPA
jgi:hypothetical protein